MKATLYFQTIRLRPDRAWIQDEWIRRAISTADKEAVQADGRIRRWKRIPEAENRVLRIILLPDGETVHNAFFDRNIQL